MLRECEQAERRVAARARATFLMENLDEVAKPRELRRVLERMVEEYGNPTP